MSETISYTQAFNKITEQMQSLYYDKNRDYGNSFAVTWPNQRTDPHER